jgi:membrane protein implicated in regulation of membrane protease activity
MSWWIWAAIGFLLLAGELLTPGGFYIVFFGVSALCVAIVSALFPAFPFWLQWLLFSVLALVALLFFRRPLLEWFRRRSPSRQVDSLVGETAVAMEDIAPGAIGKAELRGSAWNAQNVGGELLPRGRRCRVERVEGLTLHIRGS